MATFIKFELWVPLTSSIGYNSIVFSSAGGLHALILIILSTQSKQCLEDDISRVYTVQLSRSFESRLENIQNSTNVFHFPQIFTNSTNKWWLLFSSLRRESCHFATLRAKQREVKEGARVSWPRKEKRWLSGTTEEAPPSVGEWWSGARSLSVLRFSLAALRNRARWRDERRARSSTGGLQDRYVSVSLQAGRVNYIPGLPAPFLSFLRAPAHTPVQCAAESSSWRSVKRRWLRGRAVIGNRKAQPTRIQIIRPFIGTSCPSRGRRDFAWLPSADSDSSREPPPLALRLSVVYFLSSLWSNAPERGREREIHRWNNLSRHSISLYSDTYMATLLTDPYDFWMVTSFERYVSKFHDILIISFRVTVVLVAAVL